MQLLQMSPPSFRQIAAKLGLSASTVSRAFHQDPRIRPETVRRVMAALKAEDYQLDPIVSIGMSKIRQRRFYRETIAWCGDSPRKSAPWVESLFQSAEDYGARLGYKIEYFHFERNHPAALARLGAIWKARGIRGVLLGPFRSTYENLSFPWSDFAWVVIGRPFERPALHSLGRDYPTDIRTALRWLGEQGCRRVCFLQDPGTGYAFRQPLLLASLAHYHGIRPRPRTPCFEPDARQPEKFNAWLKENRPDGLILPHWREPLLRRLDSLPTVLLTSPATSAKPGQRYFSPRFEVMGQSAANLLHRLLSNRELGIPAYKQSIVINSHFLPTSPGIAGNQPSAAAEKPARFGS